VIRSQISEADASRSLTKHRKIASSFRDSQLYDIFQLSSSLLRTALDNKVAVLIRAVDLVGGFLAGRSLYLATTVPIHHPLKVGWSRELEKRKRKREKGTNGEEARCKIKEKYNETRK
jgi:hypothetical protein